MKLRIRTPSELATSIEDIIWDKDVSVMEAVLIYCEKNGLEIEVVASAIRMNSNLKARIQIEAEQLNFLKKTSRLPV